MTGSVFFQHPMGLWDEEPYSLLAEEMGPVGKGIYWDVFETIRLARGVDSLEHLQTLYDGVKNRRHRESLQRKLNLVLSKYRLFSINAQGMVTIVDYAKDVRNKNRVMREEEWLW